MVMKKISLIALCVLLVEGGFAGDGYVQKTINGVTLPAIPRSQVFKGSRQKTIDGVEYTYSINSIDSQGWPDAGAISIDKAEFSSKVESVVIPSQIDGIAVARIGSECFKNCSRLKQVKLPPKTLMIGLKAFAGCKALESVSGLESCIRIGFGAFMDCWKLKTKIVFKHDIIMDLGSTFAGCRELESVEFHGRINSGANLSSNLPINIFADCWKLTRIKFPVDIKWICDGAFMNCRSLTEVVIPDSVTHVFNEAFKGCSTLADVKIPSKTKNWGNEVFAGCTSLKNIKLPFAIDHIGSGMFDGCSSLESVKIPTAVTRIYDNAFKGCASLQKTMIPRNVTEIGVGCFEGCVQLRDIELPPKVNKLLPSVFAGCAALKGMKLTSIKSIDINAFKGCAGLQTVDMPNVSRIGHSAFQGCRSLRSVFIPDGCDCSVGEGARFEDCEALVSVDIPAKLNLGKVFKNCPNITSINTRGRFPFGRIDDEYFAGLTNLKAYTVPEDVTEIHSFAFSNCTSLTTVVLPVKLKEIHGGAFYGCAALSELQIPASTKTIGRRAFAKCTSLQTIELPSGQCEVALGAFEGCSSLRSVKLPQFSRKKKIGEAMFKGCTKLRTVTIPDDTQEIDKEAFDGCEALTEIRLPESITNFGDGAFRGCVALTSFKIPASARNVEKAFRECPSYARGMDAKRTKREAELSKREKDRKEKLAQEKRMQERMRKEHEEKREKDEKDSQRMMGQIDNKTRSINNRIRSNVEKHENANKSSGIRMLFILLIITGGPILGVVLYSRRKKCSFPKAVSDLCAAMKELVGKYKSRDVKTESCADVKSAVDEDTHMQPLQENGLHDNTTEQAEEFRLSCPHCGQHFIVETDMCGMECECPTCGKMLVVPNNDSIGKG